MEKEIKNCSQSFPQDDLTSSKERIAYLEAENGRLKGILNSISKQFIWIMDQIEFTEKLQNSLIIQTSLKDSARQIIKESRAALSQSESTRGEV